MSVLPVSVGMAAGMAAGMAGEAQGAMGNAIGMAAGMAGEARGAVDDARGMAAGIMGDAKALVVKVAPAPGSPKLDPRCHVSSELKDHGFRFPGELASALGIEPLPDSHERACCGYAGNGKVTKKWVVDNGNTPEEMVDRELNEAGEPKYKKDGEEMTDEQREEREAALIEAAEEEPHHGDGRYLRICPAKDGGFSKVPNQVVATLPPPCHSPNSGCCVCGCQVATTFASPGSTWWKDPLLGGEGGVLSFQCGGMKGMPGMSLRLVHQRVYTYSPSVTHIHPV